MRVKDDREFNVLLECTYKLISLLRADDTCHILDTDGLNAHAFHILGKLDISLCVVHGTERVANSTRCVSARLNCLVNGNLEVSYIVKCIKNPDDVDSVFNALCHKFSYNIVRVMLVAEKILTSEKHLKLCVRTCLANLSESLPRILVQVTQTRIKCCAAPAFQRVVTRLVHC